MIRPLLSAHRHRSPVLSFHGLATLGILLGTLVLAPTLAMTQESAESAADATGPAAVTVQDGRLIRDRDQAEILRVEAAAFRMGTTPEERSKVATLASRFGSELPQEALASEQPAHEVELPTFFIDRFEVTNARYGRFVTITQRDPPSNSFGSEYDVWRSGTFPDLVAQHPVVNISWDDAVAYCEWVGARLPTEAEWEMAARGTRSRVFPWGNHWDQGRANQGQFDAAKGEWKGYALDGHLNTGPVGSFPAGKSQCGAEDMAGNALEWVEDVFDPTYYARSPGRSPMGPDPPPPPPEEDAGEEEGPPDAGEGGDTDEPEPEREERVLRGGSWYYGPVRLRSAFRHHLRADVRNANTGFRCAHSLP